MTKNKGLLISIFSSLIAFLTLGLYPYWQLISYKGDIGEGGLGLIVASFFLSPFVFILAFLLSYVLHKFITKVPFSINYAVLLSALAMFLSTSWLTFILPMGYRINRLVTEVKISPNIRIENQSLLGTNFEYDILLNNNTDNVYSLNKSHSNFGPKSNDGFNAIISVNHDSYKSDNFNLQKLNPGINRIHIINTLITDIENYRYKDIINAVGNNFYIMSIINIGELNGEEIYHKTHLFEVDPQIVTRIRELYQ